MPVRQYPGQSRQAIIFRLAALFGFGRRNVSPDQSLGELGGRIVKAGKFAKPKARLGTKKPVAAQYAEVLRLRQIIAEMHSAKPTRGIRSNAK
jgi:hypothetical protein